MQSERATFSRYFLLDAFSLPCAIWIVSAYIKHHSRFLVKYKLPQQLDYRENWIYAYRIYHFSQNYHPSSINLWIPLLLLIVKLNAHFIEILSVAINHILETKISLADRGFQHNLARFRWSSYWTANCSSKYVSRCHFHATWWSGNILMVRMITSHEIH